MRRPYTVILGALFVWMLVGCGLYDGGSEPKAGRQEGYEESRAVMAPSNMKVRQVSLMADEAVAETVEMPAAGRQRMVIKTANLDLEIEKYEPWMDEVQSLVKGFDGFLVSSSTRQAYENVKRGELTIRVPQSGFAELLERLKGSAVKVEGERVGGQDVTEEFFDLEARLGNQKRTEKRFLEILEVAKTVEEILNVERELSRVREQIERLEGRRRYLKDRVDLSTVSVEWHEPYPLGSGDEGQSFWGMIVEGFERGLEGFAAVLQGLITFVIAALPAAGFLWLVVWAALRLIRWRRSRTLI